MKKPNIMVVIIISMLLLITIFSMGSMKPILRIEYYQIHSTGDYAYCKIITINHTYINQILINFPVWVYNISVDFTNNILTNGSDIAFYDSTHTTLFNHKIEIWNKSKGEVGVWVTITLISNSTNTSFYMYYGDSDTTNQPHYNPKSVWNYNYTNNQSENLLTFGTQHSFKTMNIQIWGSNMYDDGITDDVGRWNAWAKITRTQNGKLCLIYSHGSRYYGESYRVYSRIGVLDINNTTVSWGSQSKCFPNDPSHGVDGICTTPNGTILWSYGDNWVSRFEISRLYKSYDNGLTWCYSGNFPEGVGRTHFETYGNTVYAFGWHSGNRWNIGNKNASFWKSTDNASTWELVAWINSSCPNYYIDETHFIHLNDTHILGYSRCYPYIPNTTWELHSYDNGVTWSITNASNKVGWIIDPFISWLNKEKSILILTGRYVIDYGISRTHCQISNDFGVTWRNLSFFQLYSPPALGNGYGGTAYVNNNTVYHVYFAGYDTYSGIYGQFIKDNTTYLDKSK